MPNVWQSVLDEIKTHVSDMAYETYFTQLKLISNENGILTIEAPNIFVKQQIESKYRDRIRAALEALDVGELQIKVEVAKVEKKHNRMAVEVVSNAPIGQSETPNRSSSAVTPIPAGVGRQVPNSVTHSKKPRFTTVDSGLNPRFLLSDYVIGSNNDLAMSAAQAVIREPGLVYNPLFIYGGAGVGKTHLIQGIGNEIHKQHPELRILYVTIEQFYSDFVNAMKNKISGFAEKYRNLDVLIIDDFQFIAGKEKSQEEFFHTFNELYQHNKQVIVASDRLPTEIATVDPRLSSRLTMGMSVDIQLPDFETRCAIIKLKTELKGDEIDDETVQYLAKNIQTNVRDLEGNLTRILALASIRGITPREVIGGEMDSVAPQIMATANRGRVAQPKKVIETVSNYYGIEAKELLGRSRQKDIKTARQIAMYLMNEELNLSTVRIGNEFQKDHTTIMHGIKVIKEDLKNDFNLRSQISELREKIYE
jgi:chromosomal replication initiator protein